MAAILFKSIEQLSSKFESILNQYISKKKISLILLTTLFTLVFTSTYAQGFIDWHWDDHGLKFSAPSDMMVEVNNGDQFGARLKNDLFHL